MSLATTGSGGRMGLERLRDEFLESPSQTLRDLNPFRSNVNAAGRLLVVIDAVASHPLPDFELEARGSARRMACRPRGGKRREDGAILLPLPGEMCDSAS